MKQSTRTWCAALAVCLGLGSACEVDGGPRSTAVTDRFADADAVSWYEGDEMVTEIRASDDLVARARVDFASGSGWIETSLATFDVEVPTEPWTEHEANAFAHDFWRESASIDVEDSALPDGNVSFRSEPECNVSADCCNWYLSCSICESTSYGEACTVMGGAPIPMPQCVCVEA